MSEKIYADGIFIKVKEGIEWEEYSVSFKVEEVKAFLDKHVNDKGYVNCNLKNSQAGGKYLELDTWKPTPQGDEPKAPDLDVDAEMPF